MFHYRYRYINTRMITEYTWFGLVWVGCILDMLNKLGVEEGEASKLVLVEVHHEQLVSGCEVCALTSELPVKVGHVLAVTLKLLIILVIE